MHWCNWIARKKVSEILNEIKEKKHYIRLFSPSKEVSGFARNSVFFGWMARCGWQECMSVYIEDVCV